MKLELDLTRERLQVPPVEPTSKRVDDLSIARLRKGARVATDALLREGLLKGAEPLKERVLELMTELARQCLELGVQPEVGNLIAGTKGLVEGVRVQYDRAVLLQNWQDAMTCLVMMEITCRGLFALTNDTPYEDALRAYDARLREGAPEKSGDVSAPETTPPTQRGA